MSVRLGSIRGLAGLAIALGLGLGIEAPSGSHAQGPGGGGPPGGDAGPGDAPRGSGVPLEEATGQSRGGVGGFGGSTGGRGRSGGTIGAPTRGGLGTSPGDPSDSRLGRPIGASGTANLPNVPGRQGQFLGSRIGPLSNSLVGGPAGGPETRPGRNARQDQIRRDRLDVQPPRHDPITLAPGVRLEIPAGPEDPGPPDGLTLDAAMELLFRRNLDLMALRYEIPKAQADILTAGLRNNPLVYADGQLIPYGHYSYLRPGGSGGQPQYDVNFSIPIDVSRKRRARIESAERAKKVTEAQLQDSARQLVDDLYRAYVNALAARETARFTEAYLAGITRIYEEATRDCERKRSEAERAKAEHGEDSDEAKAAEEEAKAACEAVDHLDDQVRQGRFQLRRAEQALARTRRMLALLLNLPPGQDEAIRLRGSLRVVLPLPAEPEAIVRTALESRPDLAAYRLGVGRAQAEVRLARANRFSDIYLVYQPYTLQSGRAFGSQGTYSYAVGVNAALPVFNRNQGNIARAEYNVGQTRSRLARDLAYQQYQQDPSKINEYLDKQKDHNEVVEEYRNALIDHRQAMLDLNTAVGVRLFP
jgi:cobalt-zinc-cadmium efflux system outer membrane protein